MNIDTINKVNSVDKISSDIKENSSRFVDKDIRVKIELMKRLQKPLTHGKGKRKRKKKK